MRNRVRMRAGVAESLGWAGAACLLALGGCGETKPAPVVDRFQPSRPTPPGALADAVRQAGERGAAPSGTGAERAAGAEGQAAGSSASASRDSVRDPGRFTPERRAGAARPMQAASVLPADPVRVVPEPLSGAQLEAIERYLHLLARLNAELAGASAGSRPEAAMDRVLPVVDDLRGTLDGLLNLSAGQRLTVRRDFGVRQRSLEGDLRARLEALRANTAMGPLVTLVGDVPGLE